MKIKLTEEQLKILIQEQKEIKMPADTTIKKIPFGSNNNIMIASGEENVAHTYKIQIIADGRTYNPNIESIKLYPNKYLKLKIKLLYLTGNAVESRLSKAKSAMEKKGIHYKFIKEGLTSSDRIIFTIYTNKNSDTRNGILKAIKGEKPITLTDSNGVKVKLV
tara:strand:+ start:875 stop:1363 length:489 start_codon:yes stop_codon:yes gene_type:complete